MDDIMFHLKQGHGKHAWLDDQLYKGSTFRPSFLLYQLTPLIPLLNTTSIYFSDVSLTL
jgi:hypothetical protein